MATWPRGLRVWSSVSPPPPSPQRLAVPQPLRAPSSRCSWGREKQAPHTAPRAHCFFKVPARFCCCWGSRVHDYRRPKCPSVTIKVYLKTNTSCAASSTCGLKIHDDGIRRSALKWREIFITLFEKHQTLLRLNLKCAASWVRGGGGVGREVPVLKACPLVSGNVGGGA